MKMVVSINIEVLFDGIDRELAYNEKPLLVKKCRAIMKQIKINRNVDLMKYSVSELVQFVYKLERRAKYHFKVIEVSKFTLMDVLSAGEKKKVLDKITTLESEIKVLKDSDLDGINSGILTLEEEDKFIFEDDNMPGYITYHVKDPIRKKKLIEEDGFVEHTRVSSDMKFFNRDFDRKYEVVELDENKKEYQIENYHQKFIEESRLEKYNDSRTVEEINEKQKSFLAEESQKLIVAGSLNSETKFERGSSDFVMPVKPLKYDCFDRNGWCYLLFFEEDDWEQISRECKSDESLAKVSELALRFPMANRDIVAVANVERFGIHLMIRRGGEENIISEGLTSVVFFELALNAYYINQSLKEAYKERFPDKEIPSDVVVGSSLGLISNFRLYGGFGSRTVYDRYVSLLSKRKFVAARLLCVYYQEEFDSKDLFRYGYSYFNSVPYKFWPSLFSFGSLVLNTEIINYMLNYCSFVPAVRVYVNDESVHFVFMDFNDSKNRYTMFNSYLFAPEEMLYAYYLKKKSFSSPMISEIFKCNV